jgi:hypothetical protein
MTTTATMMKTTVTLTAESGRCGSNHEVTLHQPTQWSRRSSVNQKTIALETSSGHLLQFLIKDFHVS